MELFPSAINRMPVKFPCTCEVWGDEKRRLSKVKEDVNLLCEAFGFNMQCSNVSVIFGQEVDDDVVGAWVLQLVIPTDLQHVCSEELQRFLQLVEGQLDGTSDGFAQVRIIQNHSHKAML